MRRRVGWSAAKGSGRDSGRETRRARLLALVIVAWTIGGAGAERPPVPVAHSGLMSPARTTFSVRGAQILDVSGTPFVARGINLQFGDNPEDARGRRETFAAIAATGANLVRLQLRTTTSADQLEAALDAIVEHDMVAMPMLWDERTTCGNDLELLTELIDTLWLGRWKSVLQRPGYEPFLLLNVVNEWGPMNPSPADLDRFVEHYTRIIQKLRDAGFRVPVVVDAAHCGQDERSFLADGAREGRVRGGELLAADPYRNLIFSLHAYHLRWSGPGGVRMERNIDRYLASGLPFLIGEFGDHRFQYDHGPGIDHLRLLERAETDRFGWIAWSWKGNGGQSRLLDMSREFYVEGGRVTLSLRGEDLVNSRHGIRRTSRPATFR